MFTYGNFYVYVKPMIQHKKLSFPLKISSHLLKTPSIKNVIFLCSVSKLKVDGLQVEMKTFLSTFKTSNFQQSKVKVNLYIPESYTSICGRVILSSNISTTFKAVLYMTFEKTLSYRYTQVPKNVNRLFNRHLSLLQSKLSS